MPARIPDNGREMSSRKPSRLRAFTLVEMLVVVAIILIVAVIALPAVGSLAKSGAQRSAVGQLLGVLDQARAVALSQGTTVYVAFADADPSVPAEYRFRSYAIFREVYYPELRNHIPAGKKIAEPYQLEVVRPWTLLPEGVALAKGVVAGLDAQASSGAATVFDGPRKMFHFWFARKADAAPTTNTAAGAEISLPYLRFNAMGLLEQENGQPWVADLARLRVLQGFVKEDGSLLPTNKGREDVLRLSTVTGRARREEAENAG